jgi:hypothetical protein
MDITGEGGHGVEPTRVKEMKKDKEESAEDNTKGSLGCWEDMGRN